MIKPLLFVCLFTFLIHVTETLVYGMRLAGVRTRQIAIALSFVTSSLLISRLSNMFQAPLLGTMVDSAIAQGTPETLEGYFRIILFAGFLGTLIGAFLSPTMIVLYQRAIVHFLSYGSIPKMAVHALKPRNLLAIARSFRLPRFASIKQMSMASLPKSFLILNIAVTAVYSIGVLCSLLAGACLPELRATAIQLSGIVNGIATILFTLFVDPAGARITDQAIHGVRPESDVRSVVFYLQMGRLFGILIVAQLMFTPFTQYIIWVTRMVATTFGQL